MKRISKEQLYIELESMEWRRDHPKDGDIKTDIEKRIAEIRQILFKDALYAH